jgi:small subunit ribosomal protein S20
LTFRPLEGKIRSSAGEGSTYSKVLNIYIVTRSDTLANTPQARKRARQAEKHRLHNASMKSAMRTTIKNTRKAIASGDAKVAEAALNEASSKMDRLARKNIIHKNAASRYKSRLAAGIKKIAKK